VLHAVDEAEPEGPAEQPRDQKPDDGRQSGAMEHDHDDDAEAEDEEEILEEVRLLHDRRLAGGGAGPKARDRRRSRPPGRDRRRDERGRA
jgi:hypothetical protein